MSRILIVEDDPSILYGLKHNLSYEGYEVLTARDGEEGLAMALEHAPDVVILDVMLPGKNGFEILRELRARSQAGVVMLSAKDAETDKVLGLDLGADDYVAKPFGLPELLARLKAVLRRRSGAQGSRELRFGEVAIHPDSQTVTRGGVPVELTPQEYRLLTFLFAREGKALSRNAILDGAWGVGYDGTTRTVDNFVRSLRVKLEADPEAPRHFLTIRGFGYRFER
ncbi:response regulator transcription factor [Vulgatibacter incomptus]|uniref:Phosphate regulon transcriptional regulatory protein PhoB (SphR) n=1 Tax=Vulgatibacter incomptus TaxID=1391653 RepID=A0A0K1P9E3_9BACT|nr:response regulator transcription factor [Vulgatibacter incomptus]AKU90158.1 Phosphate regulon transcriptional regulatory protein PhoB (SphR) [Vulgatibacter incomptus]